MTYCIITEMMKHRQSLLENFHVSGGNGVPGPPQLVVHKCPGVDGGTRAFSFAYRSSCLFALCTSSNCPRAIAAEASSTQSWTSSRTWMLSATTDFPDELFGTKSGAPDESAGPAGTPSPPSFADASRSGLGRF
jgi:hypothetical protein